MLSLSDLVPEKHADIDQGKISWILFFVIRHKIYDILFSDHVKNVLEGQGLLAAREYIILCFALP